MRLSPRLAAAAAMTCCCAVSHADTRGADRTRANETRPFAIVRSLPPPSADEASSASIRHESRLYRPLGASPGETVMSSLVSEPPSPDASAGALFSQLGDPGDAGWITLTEPQELCTLDVCVEAPPLRLQPLELSAAMLRDGFTIADGRY